MSDLDTTDGVDVLTAGGTVAAVGNSGVVAYETADGRERWRGSDPETNGATLADGLLVYGTEDGRIQARTLASGERQWERTVAGTVTEQLSNHGGTTLVAAAEELVALDAAAGDTVWNVPLDDEIEALSVANGVGYVATRQQITAVDVEEGRQTLSVNHRSGQRPDLAVSGDVIVLTGRDEGELRGFSTTGDVLWRHDLAGWESIEATTLAAGEGGLYVRTTGRRDGQKSVVISRLDPTTGDVQWNYEDHRGTARLAEDPVESVAEDPALLTRTPILVRDGPVWAIDGKGLVVLSGGTGRRRRRWRLPAGLRSVSFGPAGEVYLASTQNLYALDTAGGDRCRISSPQLEAEYSPAVPSNTGLRLRGQVATDGECEALATAELWVAGDLRAMNGVYVPPTESGILRVGYPTSDFPEDVEEVTVRIRDTGGTVVLERTVPVDDYREEPARFEIVCSSLDARQIAPGEAVTASVDVRNLGYDTGYLATLETEDGDVLVEQRGEVPMFLDDAIQRCEGTKITLSHAFDEPGEYELTVRIAPAADEGSTAIRRLGTVRVGESKTDGGNGADDFPVEPVVGSGAGAAALVLGYLWYRGRVRED